MMTENEELDLFRSTWYELNRIPSQTRTEEFSDMIFSDDQMFVLCKHVGGLAGHFVHLLMTHPQMTPEYVDLMFIDPTTMDVESILLYCECVQPRHLDMAISFAEAHENQSADLMYHILEHPSCTDAMKVKYHLMGNVE